MNRQQGKYNRQKESIHNTTLEGEKVCMNQRQAWRELQRKRKGRVLIFDTVHITKEFIEQCRAEGITIEFTH